MNQTIRDYMTEQARKGGLKARNQSQAAKASWSKGARVKRKARRKIKPVNIEPNEG